MTIYADEIFAVNSLSALLLIYVHFIIKGMPFSHLRITGAVLLCGIYSVFETVFSLPAIIRLPILICMTAVSSGIKGLIKNTFSLMFLSVCAEAATVAVLTLINGGAFIGGGIVTVFAPEGMAAIVYTLSYPTLILIKRLRIKMKKNRNVRIRYNGKEVSFSAMYDSGNLLKYHGKPVIIISWSKAAELFEADLYEELMSASEEFVMYGTIGSGGIIPIFKPECCFVGENKKDIYAAITENDLGGYSAIVGDI